MIPLLGRARGSRGPALFVLLALIAWPALVGFRTDEAEEPAAGGPTSPVVFIIFDEWSVSSILGPDGTINEARYPNIASLASRSTWFAYDGTAHPFTDQAVPAILTGSSAKPDAAPTYDNYPNNLFTLLGGSYRIHAFESDTHLCPDSLCQPPSNYDPPPRLPRAERFARFLDEIDGSASTLHFLHVVLPHAPFEYLPSGRSYEPGPALEGLRGEVWDAQEPWYATFSYERDLLQARFADQLIGDLTARLEQLGIYDQSTIVITADHGVSFRPGEAHRRPLGASRYEVGLVPLFMKAPYQSTGTTDTTHVRSIDVLPTLAGQLGITVPWPTEGRDMLAQPDPPVELRVTDLQHGDSAVLEDPEGGLAESAGRLAGIFGDGTGPNDLFAFGPNADLVGMSLEDVLAPSGQDLPVPVQVHDVHPDSGVVPAFINGLVDVPPPPDGYVAVAVNDVVAVVVPALALPRDRTRFIAVVPDGLFVDGDNAISAVWISGAGPDRRIEALSGWSLLGDRLPPP